MIQSPKRVGSCVGQHGWRRGRGPNAVDLRELRPRAVAVGPSYLGTRRRPVRPRADGVVKAELTVHPRRAALSHSVNWALASVGTVIAVARRQLGGSEGHRCLGRRDQERREQRDEPADDRHEAPSHRDPPSAISPIEI